MYGGYINPAFLAGFFLLIMIQYKSWLQVGIEVGSSFLCPLKIAQFTHKINDSTT
jgi:hypothetical protein